MTTGVCRVGDSGVGICYAHDEPTEFVTVFVTGDDFVTHEGIPICRVGTIGVTSCGHHTKAMTGSSISIGSDGQPLHRVGDVGIVLEDDRGVYVATTGSECVFSE